MMHCSNENVTLSQQTEKLTPYVIITLFYYHIIISSYNIVIILLLHMIILKGRQIVKICSLQRNMREIFVIRVSSANCGQVWRAQ